MRPTVNIKANNLIDKKLSILTQTLPIFTALEGVVAIMLDGGLSRGYADELSEIDVVLFLEDGAFQKSQQCIYPIATGITILNDALFDIKLLCYGEELQKEYDPVAQWDLSYAKTLYDPQGKLAALFKQKLTPVQLSSAGGYMFDAWWHFTLACNIWQKRGDAAQGHLMLNNAIKPLLCALFILNGEYIPHDKWLVHMSRSLQWLPSNWDTALEGMLLVPDLSMEGLASRQARISLIWQKIDEELCLRMGVRGVDSTKASALSLLCELLTKGPLPLSAFQEKYAVSQLNGEPFHSIVKIEGGLVSIDAEKLLALRPEQMYPWYYDIVKAAAI